MKQRRHAPDASTRCYLRGSSRQASALDTSNLPGASISIDFTTPSSIMITPRRAAEAHACAVEVELDAERLA